MAIVFVLALLFLFKTYEAKAAAGVSFKATALFEVVANSTCGRDTPTFFVFENEQFNCSSGDHEVSFLLDNDSNTWWQSENGVDPVSIIFSLGGVEPSVSLTGVQLVVRSEVPDYFWIQIHGSNFIEERIYASNITLCENMAVMCSIFFVDNGIVDLEILPRVSQAITGFSLVLSGGNFESIEASYYTLVDVDIFVQIIHGFYASTLAGIQVEGESGIVVQPASSSVPQNSSSLLFPRFSGRGYASLNYSQSENVIVQWIFPSFPTSSEYQIGFRYSSHDRRNRRRSVSVVQGSRNFVARVTFLANCLACTAYLTNPDASQVSQNANYSLVQSMLTIMVTFSSVDISLDTIIAIPQHFYHPISLDDEALFLTTCDISESILLMDTFCIQMSLQLSLEFFLSTFECQCMSDSYICEAYGGQCECDQVSQSLSSRIGRQCELCPLYTYHSIGGCTACTCPDQFDDCNLMTGDCSGCPPLTFGSRCEDCVSNAYRNDDDDCMPCDCDPIGSVSCDQSSGRCICKEGVTGETCSKCNVAHFNYSLSGCTPCECGSGSLNSSCDNDGQCQCAEGVSGLKCSLCSDGFHSPSSQGCTACFCSNMTDKCSPQTNSTSSGLREICDCPFPLSGSSCEKCVLGYFLSNASGFCEQCNCNGRAETCADGSGECNNCRDNSTGASCEICIPGTYDADPSVQLSCQLCPCSTVTAANTSCVTDDLGRPFCHCLPGHSDRFCETCSSGYFGSPPDIRCTDCSCNGNIDLGVLGSCDSNTGQCLICINNSTGDECELCEVGYFGNATDQACQLCDCDDTGSVNSLCDRNSGQCSCLDGIGGLRCDRCEEGFWDFTSGGGCQQCQCSEASIDSTCNLLTGQCLCKYGVEALGCTLCMDGFYNFSSNGCSECNCSLGSFNRSCSDNGICYCRPGVTGIKCNQCLPFHFSLSSTGCQPCAGCENMLTSDLSKAQAGVIALQQNFSIFVHFMNVDLTNSTLINSSLLDITVLRSILLPGLDVIEMDLRRLNETALNSLVLHSLRTEDLVEDSLTRTSLLLPRSLTVQDQVLNVHNAMQDVFVDTGNVDIFITSIENLLMFQVDRAIEIDMDVLSRSNHTLANLLYEEVQSFLIRAQSSVETSMKYLNGQKNSTDILQAKYSILNVSDLLLQLSKIGHLINSTACISQDISASLSKLLVDRASIINVISLTDDSVLNNEMTIAHFQMLLFIASGDIQALALLIGDLPDRGSGDSGSGDLSGSGMDQDELMVAPVTINSIDQGLLNLRYRVEELTQLIFVRSSLIMDTADISLYFQATALVNHTLRLVLEQGNLATETIIDYSSILNILAQVQDISSETETVFQHSVFLLGNIDLHGFNLSNYLLHISLEQFSDIEKLLSTLDFSEQLQCNALNKTADLVVQLRTDVGTLAGAINLAEMEVNGTLMNITNDLNEVHESFVEISSTLTSITDAIPQVLASINISQSVPMSTEMLLATANISAISVLASIANVSSTLSGIRDVAGVNGIQLYEINSSLSVLHSRLSQAFDAVAMIDVALELYENLSFTYPLQSLPVSQQESISLLFNPEDTFSGNLVQVAPTDGNGSDSKILQLKNASLFFNYGSGVIRTGDETVQSNKWYQVYATRDLNGAVLSLASWPVNGSTITVSATISRPSLFFLVNDSITIGGDYTGCLDRLAVNQQRMFLLTPLENSDIYTCGPRPPSEVARGYEDGAWLLGGGSYIQITSQPLQSIQFEFRSLDSSGILLFYPSNQQQYFLLYLSEGKIMVDYNYSPLDFLHLETEATYNSGLWHHISVMMFKWNITVAIDGVPTLRGSSSTVLEIAFTPLAIILLGGISPTFSTDADNLASFSSVAGCVRNLQFGGLLVNLQESVSNRVDFGGCPQVVSSGVRFMGTGRAEFPISAQTFQSITFTFRTTQLAALLFSFGNLSISLFHTKLRLDIADEFVLVSDESGLNDNTQHVGSVQLSSLGNMSLVILAVNGRTKSALLPRISASSDRLFVGGTSGSIGVGENFRGCIDNLTLNGRMLDFETAEVLLDVSLYGCHAGRGSTIPFPLPPPPIPPPPSRPFNQSVGLNGRNGSFISLQLPEDQVLESFSITLDFVTVSSKGLLLYMQGNIYRDFFSLQLIAGRLLYSYNLGSGTAKIKSNASYNDGFLHRVEIQRNSRMGQLVIDHGTEAVNGTSPGTFSSLNVNSGYLFIGGIPAMEASTSMLAQAPVPTLGCFYTLSINGVYEDLRYPQASNGVEECLAVYNNIAALHQDSYLIMLDGFNVGVQLNITVDFRTNNCTGLLLYVASSIYSDHLLVELRNGLVVLVFDNGPMQEMLEYSNTGQLCDGNWHSLFVSKNRLVGTIAVDGNSPQTVVSSCDVCQSFFAVNSDDPLYIGGIPGTVRSRYTVESKSFEGCLRNLYVHRDGSKPEALLFSQAIQSENVEFDSCF